MIVPEGDEPLEGGDELLFVAVTEVEDELRELCCIRRTASAHRRAYAGGGVARSWHPAAVFARHAL